MFYINMLQTLIYFFIAVFNQHEVFICLYQMPVCIFFVFMFHIFMFFYTARFILYGIQLNPIFPKDLDRAGKAILPLHGKRCFTEGFMYSGALFTYKPDFSALPHDAASRLFLHRPFFRRYLSHLLIAILLILAPITFSNDNIPNFQPECETRSSLRVTARNTIAPLRSSGTIVLQESTASPSPRYSFPAPLMPAALQISLATPGRAPPA